MSARKYIKVCKKVCIATQIAPEFSYIRNFPENKLVWVFFEKHISYFSTVYFLLHYYDYFPYPNSNAFRHIILHLAVHSIHHIRQGLVQTLLVNGSANQVYMSKRESKGN